MNFKPTTIERALELAATGRFPTVTAIKTVLRQERYDGVDAHLGGGGISRQLKDIMKCARSSAFGHEDNRSDHHARQGTPG